MLTYTPGILPANGLQVPSRHGMLRWAEQQEQMRCESGILACYALVLHWQLQQLVQLWFETHACRMLWETEQMTAV
jgi:hypothetical protein